MPRPDVPQVEPSEAATLAAGGAVILDVREVDEWTAGHVADSLFVPMSEVQARQGELPHDRRIVAVCRVGGRSAAVVEALNAWGFDSVNLEGGLRAWEASGLPLVTDHGTPGTVV